ncbi:MAG: hypothetical protein IT204_06940 [Fimbriimonadaceae bacterium]|nr:hypothetical protein [Fimbriimonadaceae bacterium]
MAGIDFEAHNAEVKEMWAAYHRGEPTRVPIIFGINVRYTMDRADANPDGIDFVQYTSDPAMMLQRQLEHQCWIRHHLPHDAEMGLPTGWHVHTDFQNTYEAAWFGCPLRFHRHQVPDTTPILGDDQKRLLFDQGIPDPFTGGVMARAFEYRDYFLEQVAKGYEYRGVPLVGAGVTGLGTDGPVTVACNIRGATEFFTDLLADPEYAYELLDYIVEATIVRIRALRQRFGHAAMTPGWGFADDSVQLLSPAQYRDLVLPHHRKLIAAFSEGGPNSIHLCGDATQHFVTLRDELNIQSFDTGFPVDHGRLRRELGEAVQLQGGPAVPFLCHATPAQVRAEVRRILETGVREGGRFILREGNNLAPEIPLANVVALYEAGREYGS